MEKILPIFYTEYGRYLSRFRSIPYEVDCLIPAHRRMLLTLFEVAPKKFAKCLKLVGHCTGNYHPHGDSSAYGVLISLYKQGFVDGQGNLGSKGFVDEGSPAGMRYPEAKLKKWIKDLAFEYINDVEWEEFEYMKEPPFLPCPIPVGLIGTGGVYNGLAFHRTVIPRYKLSDLAKRLKYLLTQEESDKIIIYPNAEYDGCIVREDDEEALKLLETGEGTLVYCPNGEIKKNMLIIYGKSPLSERRINRLLDNENVSVRDIGEKGNIEAHITPKKRVTDPNEFFEQIYSDFLENPINFKIFVCDDVGKVLKKGIDDILLLNYERYVEVVRYKKIHDCVKRIDKKLENTIILLVREILKDDPTIKTVDAIINKAKQFDLNIDSEEFDYENMCFKSCKVLINEEDIKRVVTSRNIKALIENEVNLTDDDTEILNLKNVIQNNDQDCFNLLCQLC